MLMKTWYPNTVTVMISLVKLQMWRTIRWLSLHLRTKLFHCDLSRQSSGHVIISVLGSKPPRPELCALWESNDVILKRTNHNQTREMVSTRSTSHTRYASVSTKHMFGKMFNSRSDQTVVKTNQLPELKRLKKTYLVRKRFTHKNDIPSVTVDATITFMNPLTFSSFIQLCNTCGILK